MMVLKRPPSGGAISGGVNVVTGLNQQGGVETAEVVVVINQENAAAGIRPSWRRRVGWHFRLRDGAVFHIEAK